MSAWNGSARRPRAPRASRLRGARGDIESLDYDIDASSIFEMELQQQPDDVRRQIAVGRWAVCMVVGVMTGMLAFVLDHLGGIILTQRWSLAVGAARLCGALSGGSWAGAYLGMAVCFTASSLALVACAAALVVYVEPVAGGSGIPEVKTYLSGCKVPRLLRTTTLVCKAVGVLCSVCGGLVVGKEGPMIHTGAIIAAGLSQGSSKTCNLRTMWLKRFRNDHDKRDFVSAGAAAGVAAAFGAPIGGVLFAMEEAAAFWSQQLTWRTFFCAMCSTFCLNLLLSADASTGTPFGRLSHPGLITFGAAVGKQQHELYALQEIPLFMLMGVAGGLLGAAFNGLNERITKWRARRLQTRRSRFLEALCLAATTTLLLCALPLLLPCNPVVQLESLQDTDAKAVSSDDYDALPEDNALQVLMHELVCGPGGRTSDAVTLLLGSHEAAIKTLFHAPPVTGVRLDGPGDGRALTESVDVASGVAGVVVCALFFGFAYGMSLVTYGAMVPSGLFVPAIMSGGSLGRLVGLTVRLIAPGFHPSSPGSYALVGAAAMLGGICRMTISITVIVVEATTNVSYLIPISLTILCAKLVGDRFNQGIYDLHVHLKRYPVLPDQPPRDREPMQAKDIMTTRIRTCHEVEQVGALVELLRTTPHHGFPVLASTSGVRTSGEASVHQSRVLGIILRDQLSTILAKRVFEGRGEPATTDDERRGDLGIRSAPLTADDFMRPWFSDVNIDDLGLTRDDMCRHVNLRPYVNEAALVTLQNTSLRRVNRLFRTMGLRHLLVIEDSPRVVGIITRKDVIYGGSFEAHERRADPLDEADEDVQSGVLPGGDLDSETEDEDEDDGAHHWQANGGRSGASSTDWRGGINAGHKWWRRCSTAIREASTSSRLGRLLHRTNSSTALSGLGRGHSYSPPQTARSLANTRALSSPLLCDDASQDNSMGNAVETCAHPSAVHASTPFPGRGAGGPDARRAGATLAPLVAVQRQLGTADTPLVDYAADTGSVASVAEDGLASPATSVVSTTGRNGPASRTPAHVAEEAQTGSRAANNPTSVAGSVTPPADAGTR